MLSWIKALATNLSSVPRYHMVEGENKFLQIAATFVYPQWHMGMHTPKING